MWEFSADLVYWEYEKADFSMRFDVETGTLEQILLEAALTGMGGSYAGAKAESPAPRWAGGAKVGVRGANAPWRERFRGDGGRLAVSSPTKFSLLEGPPAIARCGGMRLTGRTRLAPDRAGRPEGQL